MEGLTFRDIEEELTALSSPGIVPGLDRLLFLLPRLGNPQNTFPAVHVVGTNGKGSACATLSSILTESGCKTAVYTSPHLVSFGERLLINGSEAPVYKWYDAVMKIKTALNACLRLENDRPTYFELVTAAAFVIIAGEEIDIAIIEAGLGGRFDATNTLGRVALTLISPIGMDHMEYLGHDLRSIATEKFDVMREDTPAIFSSEASGLEEDFREAARAKGAAGFLLREICAVRDVKTSLSGTDFIFERGAAVLRLHTPLIGFFQAENAALAICGAYLLSENYSAITDSAIKAGVAGTSWPGRFEIIARNPVTIVDGAHNPHAMKRLVETLSSCTERGSLSIVLATMKDKDAGSSLDLLKPLKPVIYCTQIPGLARSMPASELSALVSEHGLLSAGSYSDPAEALKVSRAAGRTTICCGSLYLAGYVKGHINEIIGI